MFSLLFFALGKGWKCTLSSNYHVESRIDQKMGEMMCFQQYPQSINVPSILTKFEQQGYKKTMKKEKKKSKIWRNEQPWTLTYTLSLQTMGSTLSYFFGFGLIDFPSKMMPCKINHNLICLDLEPLSEGLGTKFKAIDQSECSISLDSAPWTLV